MSHNRTAAIVVLGLSVGLSAAVSAADLTPEPAPIYTKAPLIPLWSWTGFYVGGDVGAKWGDDKWTAASLRDSPTPISLPIDGTSPTTFNTTAARVGAYAGYNWQFAPRWITGVEGDYGYSNKTRSNIGFPGCEEAGGCTVGFVVTPNGLPLGGDLTSVDLRWDASARARLGYLVTPDLLLYGTGGAAWQNIQVTGTCGGFAASPYCNGPPQPNLSSITQGATRTGWTVGAGVEWHAWGNWLLRGEYRFADFGTWNSVFPFGTTPASNNTYRFQVQTETHIATVGLAYKF
jgi:outer membrane immunogenic protein